MTGILKEQLRLCLVTNIKKRTMDEYMDFIIRAVNGGVTMVQLREKESGFEDVKEKALLLKSVLRPLGVPLIINDFVELAAEIDADGVHIGQQDMGVENARKVLGKNKIIGLSIENLDELRYANKKQCINYVTASAVFQSRTKVDCKKIWGVRGVQTLVSESLHPVTAIGGINSKNVKDVWGAKVCGIAVISAIHDSLDPCAAAEDLISYNYD